MSTMSRCSEGEGGSSSLSPSPSLRRMVSAKARSLLDSIRALASSFRAEKQRKVPKRFKGVLEESECLDLDHLEFLSAAVPAMFKHSKWDLVYSTRRHGFSLQTLLRRCRRVAPTLLVVEDMRNSVFGVFVTEPWAVHDKYYGTGETFVFVLHPLDPVAYFWKQKAEGAEAARNDYFQYSTNECIAVGGGGRYALWIDEDLLYGTSSFSPTFEGMKPLSSTEDFQVKNIEMWSLDW